MPSFEHIHNLMVEVGELMDLPQVSEFAEQRSWLLVTEGGPVAVDYDEAADRVLLTAPAGTPSPAGREALYEALLVHNGQAPDMRGVRLGLEEPDGEVVLTTERPGAGLDAGQVRSLLEGLAAAAEVWRDRVERADGAGSTTAEWQGGASQPGMVRG